LLQSRRLDSSTALQLITQQQVAQMGQQNGLGTEMEMEMELELELELDMFSLIEEQAP
jgi:hypothetical protein